MKLYCNVCNEYSDFAWDNQIKCDLCCDRRLSKTNQIRKLLEEDGLCYFYSPQDNQGGFTTKSVESLLEKIKDILNE